MKHAKGLVFKQKHLALRNAWEVYSNHPERATPATVAEQIGYRTTLREFIRFVEDDSLKINDITPEITDKFAKHLRLRSQALIMELIAVFFKRYNIELPDKFEKDLKRFESVIGLIEKSPGHKWKIQDLARKTGLKRVQFSTRFKRVFSMPHAKLIMRKRLEHARYLLLNSNRTLEDIANELGFSDAFHFSKSFKSGIGLSPKEFRARRILSQP